MLTFVSCQTDLTCVIHRFSNVVATAVSSAPRENPPQLSFTSPVAKALNLGEDTKDMLRKIDAASIVTLRDCMQTVYEDGPR